MKGSWDEQLYQGYSSEAGYGESPYSEAYAQTESEWDSPFAATEAESPQEVGQEYGQEAYAQEAYPQEAYAPESVAGEAYALDREQPEAEWESPFSSTSFATDSEILRGPDEFPKSCDDVTFDGKPWPFGKLNPNNAGEVSSLTFVPRAEVFEFQLSNFDVDRHELKRQHKEAIVDLTKRVLSGVREGRYSGDPIRVFTYGEASSTAPALHNLPLSRNRAFNALNAIRCEFQKAGISQPVVFGLYGTGEQHARVRGPDGKETPQCRGVVVRAFAPLKECAKCKTPPPPPPGYKPRPGTTAICVSIPKIAPRNASKLPPDVIPLGPIVPGLRLPIALVTRAQATVRVDDRRSRRSAIFTFQGWGLEVALPVGRARIDLRAELKASLELLVRASASLGAQLHLGPLKLALRVDLSVFARLIVKLCAQLRLRLELDLGRPNLPELRQCLLNEARGVAGPNFPFAALSGPAFLIVPGAGYGPAILSPSGAGVAGLGLAVNPMPVPADKSSVKTLLALGGAIQLSPGIRSEAEHEAFDSEWQEAFSELQPELAPFV